MKDPTTEVASILITSTDDVQLTQAITRIYVYPNPANGHCNIQLKTTEGGVGKLLLYNAQGRVLETQTVKLNSQVPVTTTFDLSAYPPRYVPCSIIYGPIFTYFQNHQTMKLLYKLFLLLLGFSILCRSSCNCDDNGMEEKLVF